MKTKIRVAYDEPGATDSPHKWHTAFLLIGLIPAYIMALKQGRPSLVAWHKKIHLVGDIFNGVYADTMRDHLVSAFDTSPYVTAEIIYAPDGQLTLTFYFMRRVKREIEGNLLLRIRIKDNGDVIGVIFFDLVSSKPLKKAYTKEGRDTM